MIKIIFNFLTLFIFVNGYSQFSTIDEQTQINLESIISDYQINKKIAGLSIGIIKDGEIVYLKGFGKQDIDENIDATENTLYRIASVSKPITGLLSMILLERGLLDLDKDIRDYVPEYPIKPQGTISSKDLLSNESGILQYNGEAPCEDPYDVDFNIAYNLNHTDRYDPIESLGIFKNQQICFTPGERFQYTTWGFCLMGAVLERAYGESFEDLVYKELIYPLNLPTFQPEFSAFGHENITKGYQINSNGNTTEAIDNHMDYSNISYKIPAGGFIATVIDICLIMKGIINSEILSKQYIDIYSTPNITDNGQESHYGYGVYSVNQNNDRVLSHSGTQMKAGSIIQFSPDTKNGVVILSNTRGPHLFDFVQELYDFIPNMVVTNNTTFQIPPRNISKIQKEETVKICSGETHLGLSDPGIYINTTIDDLNREVKEVLILEHCDIENDDFNVNVNISPNPFMEEINLDFDSCFKGSFSIMTVEGKVFLEQEINDLSTVKLNLNLSGGLYILNIKSYLGKSKSFKIVKR